MYVYTRSLKLVGNCMYDVCMYVSMCVCMERINWKLTPLSVRCVAGVAWVAGVAGEAFVAFEAGVAFVAG